MTREEAIEILKQERHSNEATRVFCLRNPDHIEGGNSNTDGEIAKRFGLRVDALDMAIAALEAP